MIVFERIAVKKEKNIIYQNIEYALKDFKIIINDCTTKQWYGTGNSA